MKQLKTVVSIFFVLFLFTETALAEYSIQWFNVQHRIYEDGRESSRINTGIIDGEGNHITSSDLITDLTLTDPNGEPVDVSYNIISDSSFGDTYYDTNTGQWHYGDLKPEVWGQGRTDAILIPGTYRLQVTVAGEVLESEFSFGGPVNLPIVPSNSYRTYLDMEGNLHWTWHVPEALVLISSDYATQVRAFIDVYQDGVFVTSGTYLKLPTHMSYCFVPKAALDKLRAKGNQFQFGIQVRTTDNSNRSYSLKLMDDFGTQGYTYYMPHYTSESGMWTGLGLKNENGETAANYTVTVYDEAGAVIQAIENKTIPANGQENFVVADDLSKRGWMMIQSDQALQGVCIFGSTAMPDYIASIPFVADRSTTITIPHTAQGPAFETLVMVANPQASDNKVTLTFTSQDGASLYSTEATIPAKGCWKYNLADLIPDSATANNSGSIEITGEKSIVGCGLYYNMTTEGGMNVAGSMAMPPTYR